MYFVCIMDFACTAVFKLQTYLKVAYSFHPFDFLNSWLFHLHSNSDLQHSALVLKISYFNMLA